MQAKPWPQSVWAALAALGAATTAASCASADPNSGDRPAWFVARTKALDAEGFPSLTAIPKTVTGGNSTSAWSAIERDVRASGDAVLASPRNVPADISDLATFEAEARAAVTPPAALGTPLSPAKPAPAAAENPASAARPPAP